MTASPTLAPASYSLPARYTALALVLILAMAGLVLWWGYIPNYGAGVDEASYLLAAKGIATRGDPAYLNNDPVVFVPENMVEPRDGVFYPIYPIGYPLLAALAYRLAGPAAAFWVNPLLTLTALLAVYLLARLFLDRVYSLAAMFFMALHPAVLYYGDAAMSHASDLACSTWCLYFAVSWHRAPRLWKAILTGLLLGYCISIRYTGALLALPVGYLMVACLVDTWRAKAGAATTDASSRRQFLHLLLAALAFFAGILPLLAFHKHAFGSLLTTGYSLTGHAAAFSFRSFLYHAPYALAALCKFPFGLSLFFPLGLVGMAVLLWARPRIGVFLALWCLPSLLLYMAYYWITRDTSPEDNWLYSRDTLLYMRFFLTLYPGFLIAALLLAERLFGGLRPAKWAVVLLTITLASVNLTLMPNWDLYMGSAAQDEAAVNLVRRTLPPDSAVVADFTSFSLIYYTDMTVFYVRYFSPAWVEERLRAPGADSGSPSDFSPRRRQRFAESLGGRTQDELSAILCARLLAIAQSGRTVGLVTNTDEPPWYEITQSAFRLVVISQDEPNHLVLLRLDPIVSAPAR